MRSSVIAALALGLCLGCVIQQYRGSTAMATPATTPVGVAPALGALASGTVQTGTTAPVLIPVRTLLVQLQNIGDAVTSSNDIVVHSRDANNDYDPATGEKKLGFAGVVSALGVGSQSSVGRDPTHGITMSMGIGIFRGLRPRLLTGVISGGAEGSTIVTYVNQNTQWMCLVEGSLVGNKRATLNLLPAALTRTYTDNMTIVVASRPNPTQPWTLDGPRPMNAAERAVCVTAWAKAQAAGIIPSTEPFPP